MITHDIDEAVLLSDRIVMMINGPAATIGQILDVNLPRPRNRVQMAGNDDYNHCRAEVLKFLYARHQHVDEKIRSETDVESEMPSSSVEASAEIKPFPKRNRVVA